MFPATLCVRRLRRSSTHLHEHSFLPPDVEVFQCQQDRYSHLVCVFDPLLDSSGGPNFITRKTVETCSFTVRYTAEAHKGNWFVAAKRAYRRCFLILRCRTTLLAIDRKCGIVKVTSCHFLESHNVATCHIVSHVVTFCRSELSVDEQKCRAIFLAPSRKFLRSKCWAQMSRRNWLKGQDFGDAAALFAKARRDARTQQ